MKKRTFPCIILLATLFSCAVVPQKKEAAGIVVPEWFDSDSLKTAYLYSEGVKIDAATGDKEAAKRYFEAVLAIDSLHAPAHYRLADAYMTTAPETAFDHSQKAYSSDTANIDYQSQLAYTHVLNRRYQTAQRFYEDLLRKDPRNPFNYRMSAALYAASGLPYAAISVLDSAEYKLGRYEELANYKRELLIGVKLYNRAIDETEANIADNPFRNDNYRILAELYGRTGKDSLARVNYAKALQLDSTNMETLMSLADYNKTKGNEQEFLGVLQRIFMLDGMDVKTKASLFEDITSNVDFYRRNYFSINTLASVLRMKYADDYNVADLYATHLIRSGELNRALDVYKEFTRRPDAPKKAFYTVMDIESYLKHPDSVALYSEQAIERFSKESEIYMRLAYALTPTAPASKVISIYRKAYRYAQTDSLKSNVTTSVGDYWYQKNNKKAAFAEYRRALKKNPDNSMALNNYAYFLSEENRNLDKALKMSERACELSPSNPTYLDTQAWILHLLGRNAEAKKIMRQAISLDTSGSSTLLMHYGDIFFAEGERFMAETYWRKALEAGENAEAIEQRMKRLKEEK